MSRAGRKADTTILEATLLGRRMLELGLSPGEVAERSGVNRSSVYRVLTKESPTAQVRSLVLIADTLEMSVEELAREWSGIERDV